MKVLLVSSKYQPEYSGSGLRAHNTYKRLEKKFGIKWDIVCNSLSYQGNEMYEYDGKEVYRISFPCKVLAKKGIKRNIFIMFDMLWQSFFSWLYIRKRINDYDVLHTFGNTWSIGFLTWYFAKHNKPIIRELCNEMPNPLYPIQFQNIMKKIFQKENTLVVAISKRLENLAKSYGIKNIWTRPNPIDESRFFVDYENKYKLREKLCKFSKNDIVLGLIANFLDRKNQLFALEMLKFLPDKYKLLLAGPLKEENTYYIKRIEEKIKEYNLQNRVEIHIDFIKNFDEYIKLCDVFLFPSKEEGLGTPLLEAQACGVPVVSNYLQGISDTVIEKGKGGYYLELDAQKWAEVIKKAINIPKNILIENAKKIHKIASSEIIDKEYYKRIEVLVNEK